MLADVIAKDYEIELDEKPYTVKNERWIGLINSRAGKGEPYFTGMVYDWNEDKQEYSVCGAGEIEKTKEEFEAEAERVTFFK